MPRLRAAGYKYTALPDVAAAPKTAEQKAIDALEDDWRRKTADRWADAELEVDPRVAQQAVSGGRDLRAATVPLPPRQLGTASPERARRQVATASPKRARRKKARSPTKKRQGALSPQRAKLEDRTNVGAHQSPKRGSPRKAKKKKKGSRAKAKASKKQAKAARKKARKEKRATASLVAMSEAEDEPAAPVMQEVSVSVGKLGGAGVGRIHVDEDESSDESSSEEEDESTDEEGESESEDEAEEEQEEAAPAAASGAGYSELKQQFAEMEALLPVGEKARLQGDLRNIEGAIGQLEGRAAAKAVKPREPLPLLEPEPEPEPELLPPLEPEPARNTLKQAQQTRDAQEAELMAQLDGGALAPSEQLIAEAQLDRLQEQDQADAEAGSATGSEFLSEEESAEEDGKSSAQLMTGLLRSRA